MSAMQNLWVRKEDLLYDQDNLRKIIRYCMAHNPILRDRTVEGLEQEFWTRVTETTRGFRTSNLIPLEGHPEPVFNAWFVVNAAQKGYYPIEGETTPGSHVIHFLCAWAESLRFKQLNKSGFLLDSVASI